MLPQHRAGRHLPRNGPVPSASPERNCLNPERSLCSRCHLMCSLILWPPGPCLSQVALERRHPGGRHCVSAVESEAQGTVAFSPAHPSENPHVKKSFNF